jgi:5-methylcytosine-specific restriction protein A
MTPADAQSIAIDASVYTGLAFAGSVVRQGSGTNVVELVPEHHDPRHTFRIQLTLGWRSVEAQFLPGQFAGDLVESMGQLAAEYSESLVEVGTTLAASGIALEFAVNGTVHKPGDKIPEPWRTLLVRLRKGQLPVNAGDSTADLAELQGLARSMLSVVTIMLPLDAVDTAADNAVAGYPEGAVETVLTNRYERDWRNRAAAIAIHGFTCKACEVPLTERYGEAANGMIEIHHLTPVSVIGPEYRVNPAIDLVPLCPNCHAVAHRRNPPYTPEEIRTFIRVRLSGR